MRNKDFDNDWVSRIRNDTLQSMLCTCINTLVPLLHITGKLSIMLSDPSTSGSSSPSSTYVNMLNDISSNGETLFIIPKLEKNDTSLGAGSTAKAVHQVIQENQYVIHVENENTNTAPKTATRRSSHNVMQ